MKKKQRTLLILAGVIVVLLLALFGMRKWNEIKEEKEEQKKQEEKISILQTEGLSAISYEDENGEKMAFTKSGDSWTYDADPEILLKADTMEKMEEAFSDIEAVKEISSPDELSDYGFDAPCYRLGVTESDGTEHHFLIGNSTGDNQYFMEENSENVYTVSSKITSEMLWSLTDLAEKDSFISIMADHFVKEEITAPDGTVTIYEASEDTEDSENSDTDEEDTDESTTDEEDPAEKVANGIAGMYFTDCIDYHVTDETKSGYGLDEASRTKVTVIYKDSQDGEKEKSITFYVGKKDGEGTYYYVQLEDSIRVNRVLAESIEAILP